MIKIVLLFCTLFLFTGCSFIGGNVLDDTNEETAAKIESANFEREANAYLYDAQAAAIYDSLRVSYLQGLITTPSYRQQLIIMDGVDEGIEAYKLGGENNLLSLSNKMSAVMRFLIKHGAEEISIIPGVL